MSDHPGPAGDPGAEPVEVVAADGTVERVVPRATMRADRLRHRATFIVVIDGADRVAVHRRAAWKDVWPSRWDLAFGGVAGVGEPWDDAARRELREEAGIDAPLTEVLAAAYDDADVSLLARLSIARHDGPLTFTDGEVVAHEWVPRGDVLAWITDRPHCPDGVALYRQVPSDLGGPFRA